MTRSSLTNRNRRSFLRIFTAIAPQRVFSLRLAVFAACLPALLFSFADTASAQRPRTHSGGVAHPAPATRTAPRAVAPPSFRIGIGTQRGFAGPRPAGFGIRTVRFEQQPILVLRQPFLFGSRSFWSEEAYNFYWAPVCGHVFASNPLGAPGYDFSCGAAAWENYVMRPAEEIAPYVFGLEGSELIWLYLKDGTVFGVTDYWFVNGQVHFRMASEGFASPTDANERYRRASEHVINLDELDAQRTIDVNTARGFRVVMRDEPLERYLRDHPNETPHDLTARPEK